MPEIHWSSEEPKAEAGQLLAVPLREAHEPSELASRFGDPVREAVERSPFKAKPGETFAFTREEGGVLQHVTLFGSGKGIADAAALRQLGHDVVREGDRLGARHVVLDLRDQPMLSKDGIGPAAAGGLIGIGIELGTYAYERFISEAKRKPRSVRDVTAVAESAAPADGARRGQLAASGVFRARDLGNGPSDFVTPTHLAEVAGEIVEALDADNHDVEISVLERDECERRGMGCFLGVARGSEQPPKFIHLTYRPRGGSKGRVALVGKGVTFDSGGYSLKPNDAMLDMKLDMSGAAAVIGAFEGAVKLQVPWELHAIVAATENMVSGAAYKLGDVLTASNGKTVEINNTDAEGRLTLADALVYASNLEPDFIVDFATLTGACLVALGPRFGGVMTNDDTLFDDWMSAADRSGEPMWRLPLPEDLKEQLKSKVADMKNTGERWGGALTAGLFLSEFTEGQRWMHVDIAGPAMAAKPYGVTTPGCSGFPVATILELLLGETRKTA